MSGITAIARLAFFVLTLGAPATLAQTAPQGDNNTELARKHSNPIASPISLPFQFNNQVQRGRQRTITLLFPT
jgi:hypothetical protein